MRHSHAIWISAACLAIVTGCGNAGQQAANSAGEAVNSLGNAAGHAGNATMDAARGAGGFARDGLNRAGGAAAGALRGAGRAAGDLAGRTDNIMGATANAVGGLQSGLAGGSNSMAGTGRFGTGSVVGGFTVTPVRSSIRIARPTSTVYLTLNSLPADVNPNFAWREPAKFSGARTPSMTAADAGRTRLNGAVWHAAHLIVPQGWLMNVTLHNGNATNRTQHQALVVPYTQLTASGNFGQTFTSRGATGTRQNFLWKARTPGNYAIICTRPGHQNEVMATFTVSSSARTPSVQR